MDGGPAEVRVLDGRAETRGWGLLRGGAGRLALLGEGPVRAWTLPAQALRWRVSEPREAVTESPSIELQLPGAQIYLETDIAPGLRVLSPAFNGWSEASEAWSRSPGGPWRFHGPWPLHGALPAATSKGAADGEAKRADPLPPSWVSEGLPPGAGALVLRLAPGGFAGPSPGAGRAPQAWLRLRLEN